MNTSNDNHAHTPGALAVAVAISLTVAGCATAPESPQGAAEVRSKLTALKSNTGLADQVPVEIREAEVAVRAAEEPADKDAALGEHRVYIADRKVEIAMATASTRHAEHQREGLSRARDQARLDARTREADAAHRATAMAVSEAEASRVSAADAAIAATDAASEAEELQQQIDVLQAEATDRGLVLTLGNVLFATGRAELKSGGISSLGKLVTFLNEHPDRRVVIEGHTDDVGSADMNQALSQRRAESVKSYLMQQGIYSQRLTASGIGETRPVADNQSASGRQQNRRVEVIIEDFPAVVPTAGK